jgi:hypothetical protein
MKNNNKIKNPASIIVLTTLCMLFSEPVNAKKIATDIGSEFTVGAGENVVLERQIPPNYHPWPEKDQAFCKIFPAMCVDDKPDARGNYGGWCIASIMGGVITAEHAERLCKNRPKCNAFYIVQHEWRPDRQANLDGILICNYLNGPVYAQ